MLVVWFVIPLDSVNKLNNAHSVYDAWVAYVASQVTVRIWPPFAPDTQKRDVCAENITPDNKVIGFTHEIKLGQLGQIARARGKTLTCPGHVVVRGLSVLHTTLVMRSLVARSSLQFSAMALNLL